MPPNCALPISKITRIAVFLFCLIASVHPHLLPVSRVKRSNFSAAQISASAALANSNTSLTFGNYQNVIYYINLNVGTPAQVMGVQFDTGSNTLWLPTQQAGVTPFYNTSKSSTFTNTSTTGSIEVPLHLSSTPTGRECRAPTELTGW
jgi:hypothetical protein